MSKTKQVAFAISIVLVIGILLGGVKVLQIKKMMAMAKSMGPPPTPVTAIKAEASVWEGSIRAVGTLEAINGMTVAAEIPGKITAIHFKPGTRVSRGALLLTQDTSSEEAQLRVVLVRQHLAQVNLNRLKQLYNRKVVSAAQVDELQAQVDQALAEADTIRIAIAKKTIRAPFAGTLGIRLVDQGQIIGTGTPIVSLQTTHPIFANFPISQEQLAHIQVGLTIALKTNVQTHSGVISTINPYFDPSTRSVGVQATVDNKKDLLRPGMFAEVTIHLKNSRQVVAIPSSAVLYSTFGDSIFILRPKAGNPNGGLYTARQHFVRLGERRGDFVSIAEGLNPGEMVVSAGAFKLRPGQEVVVNNTLSLDYHLDPRPQEG